MFPSHFTIFISISFYRNSNLTCYLVSYCILCTSVLDVLRLDIFLIFLIHRALNVLKYQSREQKLIKRNQL